MAKQTSILLTRGGLGGHRAYTTDLESTKKSTLDAGARAHLADILTNAGRSLLVDNDPERSFKAHTEILAKAIVEGRAIFGRERMSVTLKALGLGQFDT